MPQPTTVGNDERVLARRVGLTPVPVDPAENASYVLTYTGGDLTKVTKTMNGVSYERTLTWTGGDLTAVSEWTEL